MKKEPTIHMVRVHEDAILPVRAHKTDAAWDIYTPERITLYPGERKRVTTGWKIGIVPNLVMEETINVVYDKHNSNVLKQKWVWQVEVRPRSGNAIKLGVTVANSPGTVDASYRGPFDVILINLGDDKIDFEVGDRIAQMVLTKAYLCGLIESEEFPDQTQRGEGGFGHTGS